jgi:formylmethanofuran dehydrogenase subunit E
MELSREPLNTAQRELMEKLIALSAQAHGHLCPGQVIGVRMSMLGLGLLGYPCPLAWPEIKNVVGFVEIERCLADAVGTATGLRLGRGSLKFVNLGLLAATFLDIPTWRAVRVISKDDARDLVDQYVPGENDAHARQTAAYRQMSDYELFEVQNVTVHLPPDELPGARPPKVVCDQCGVNIRSGQVKKINGRNLCAVCADQAYFTINDNQEAP